MGLNKRLLFYQYQLQLLIQCVDINLKYQCRLQWLTANKSPRWFSCEKKPELDVKIRTRSPLGTEFYLKPAQMYRSVYWGLLSLKPNSRFIELRLSCWQKTQPLGCCLFRKIPSAWYREKESLKVFKSHFISKLVLHFFFAFQYFEKI